MKNLQAEREDRGWTQTQVAFHSGLAQSQISRFERGRATPTAKQAARLARALGLTVDALFRETRDPKADKDNADSAVRPTP